MKKHHLFIALLLSLPLMLSADPVGLQKAKVLAQEYTVEGISPRLLKSAKRSAISMRTDDEYAPYYIFSRGENEGFVIVSGDDCLPDIIGYTESGNYDENNMPPAFSAWLSKWADLVEFAQAKKAPARAPRKINSSWANIPYLIKDHWGQGAPYNNYAPIITGTQNRAVTGCVATSGCQAINFFRADNPDTLLATTSTYNYGDAPVTAVYKKGTPLKYDLMLYSYSGSYPQEMGDAVATLMASVGAATGLTYGSSTSGQISDLAKTMNRYFNMNATCEYKGETSLSTWENRVYNELKSGRPLVYTGVNDESGHAFILDGYNNGKFHFNFGWDGQADGYYTLDTETGVNGFSDWQGMIYGITPKKRNLSGYFKRPIELTLRATSEIQVHVESRSTLPYAGFYLLSSTNKAKPSVSSANDKNVVTSIPSGGSADLTLKFKPTLNKDYTLFLTDEIGTLLDSVTLPVRDNTADLHLTGLTVDAGIESETVNGKKYAFVNNDKAVIKATVQNRSDNYFEGTFKVSVKGNADASEEYTVSSTKTNTVLFAPKETKEILFTSNTLKKENYYTARLINFATALSDKMPIIFDSNDTIVCFRNKEPKMVCENIVDGCARITGNWNKTIFSELMDTLQQEVASFDLTALKGIDELPAAANPNTLFYVADDAAIEGNRINVIQKGRCADLRLFKGYDFRPLADFTAESVIYDPRVASNIWSTLYLPFDCAVPDGCLAKEVTEATKSKLTLEPVSELKAGIPYLYTFTSNRCRTLSAQNVKVSTLDATSDTAIFLGTFSQILSPENALILNNDAVQYFDACDSTLIHGFEAYLVVEGASHIRPTNVTTDPRYKLLGEEIALAYALFDEQSEHASEEVKTALLEAIATAEEVFVKQELNLGSKITAQTTLLKEAETEFSLHLNGSKEHPADYTGYIVNPSFELTNTTGWSVKYAASFGARPVSNLNYYCSGTDGKYLLQANPSGGKEAALSQKLAGLPKGYYKVEALIATEEGLATKLFAGNDTALVTSHKFGKFYFTAGEVTTYTEEGDLSIGVSAGQMFKADRFRLFYLGDSNIIDAVEEVTVSGRDTEPISIVSSGKGEITIHCEKTTALNLYNITGQTVRRLPLSAGSTVVRGLKAGVYIIGNQKILVM